MKRAGEKRGLFILPPNKTIKFKGYRLIVQQDSQVIEVTLQQYVFSALIRCMFAKIKQKRRVVGSFLVLVLVVCNHFRVQRKSPYSVSLVLTYAHS